MTTQPNEHLAKELYEQAINGTISWYDASCNPNITVGFILNNPNKGWNNDGIANNPNFSYLNKSYWTELCHYSKIGIEIVLKYHRNPFDWYELSCNPSITFNDILENPDKPWNWKGVCNNPNVTTKDVLNNPNKPWIFYELRNNPNVDVNAVIDALQLVGEATPLWVTDDYSE